MFLTNFSSLLNCLCCITDTFDRLTVPTILILKILRTLAVKKNKYNIFDYLTLKQHVHKIGYIKYITLRHLYTSHSYTACNIYTGL